MSAAAKLNRSLKLLAIAPVVGCSSLALAQLPPPDLLLKEPRPALLIFGPSDIHARAAASFIYDDNINLHQGPVSRSGIIIPSTDDPPVGDDFIFTLSPGVQMTKASGLQDSHTALSVDYSPSFIFFLKNEKQNSVDHSARLNAGYAFTKLTLTLAQEWTSSAGGVVDVGSRVSQDNYRTAIGARYELTEKTFLQMDGSYRITDYETLTDSEEWSVTPTANYQFSPKVSFGLGVTYGQLSVSQQDRRQIIIPARTNDTTGVVAPARTNIVTSVITRPQTYIGPTLRATYKTTEKTDLSLSFGGEWRTYEDGGSSFGPVFSLMGTYQPFQATSFSIEAHRREQNSAILSGQNYISTGVSVAMRQQLRDRLSGHVSLTFENAAYKATQRGVNATRNDDYFLMRYGLDAIVGRSWTIGVFHQYREDVSSDKTFSFKNNQAGIQATWAY
jgi:hypothetical protein